MNITLDLLKEQIIAAKTLEEAEQGMKWKQSQAQKES